MPKGTWAVGAVGNGSVDPLDLLRQKCVSRKTTLESIKAPPPPPGHNFSHLTGISNRFPASVLIKKKKSQRVSRQVARGNKIPLDFSPFRSLDSARPPYPRRHARETISRVTANYGRDGCFPQAALMSAAFGEKCYPNLSGIDQAGLGHFIASPALHPDSPATLSPARRFLEKSPAIPRLIAIVIWCVETAIPPRRP